LDLRKQHRVHECRLRALAALQNDAQYLQVKELALVTSSQMAMGSEMHAWEQVKRQLGSPFESVRMLLPVKAVLMISWARW
jgi:hypothetical protein